MKMLTKNTENAECRELCGIFYSVFHDTKGRINVTQFPDLFFSEENFCQVSNFVITKEDLANRVIVSKVDGQFVIGCLQSLENQKYPRNKFLFNVCFVVKEEVSDNLISYENVVRNVNRFFHSLEQETGRLHPAEKDVIRNCLQDIFCSLKDTGMCKYTWDGFGTIYLRMGVETERNVLVESEQVPVLNINPNKQIIPLDLTCQRVLPLINGQNRVWEIAKRSEVDLKVVRACVQNLGYFGAVKTVSPYRLGATYMCMPKLRRVWMDTEMRRQLVEHISEDDLRNIEQEKIESTAEIALRALSILGPNTKVSDCHNVLVSFNSSINCRQLIQYAEIEGLIRRIHGHPIRLVSDQTSNNADSCNYIPEDILDGTHNLEEIACLLDVPFAQLESNISNKSDIFVIWN